MLPFDHTPRTRLVFGAGSLSRLGELAAELGCKRALIVSDPGIVKAGYPARAVTLLESSGITASIFGEVHENPTTKDVDHCVAAARDLEADLLIGLGGGSSMDTAKGCNFILTNGGRMADYWGTGKARQAMLPLIAIPTTAGTGSECQSYALISDAETHAKMACGDPKAAAKIALLDPELTVSQPQRVTVCTGVDALTHALESAVTKKRSALSLLYSKEAFRLLNEGLPQVLSQPLNLAARGQMLLGAAFAGLAIENSMLGAAHSCANPLTANFGIVHGEAVGLMMPHIIRYNQQDAASAKTYAELYSGDLASHIHGLLALADMPRKLGHYGVSAADVPLLAAQASKQWTANFNPRPVDEAAFASIYTAAL
jgi:alcohol dehydrogenase